jgi:hypothetical protein
MEFNLVTGFIHLVILRVIQYIQYIDLLGNEFFIGKEIIQIVSLF